MVEAPHPLIKHWVSVLRDENTPSSIFSKFPSNSCILSLNLEINQLVNFIFKYDMDFVFHNILVFVGSAMAELGRLLIYEATRDWLVSTWYPHRYFYILKPFFVLYILKLFG